MATAFLFPENQIPPSRHLNRMFQNQTKASITARDLFFAWGKVLAGRIPLLSIEITRDCPLSCPGCYAYGENHLGPGVNLRELHDFRREALVQKVLQLIDQHRPLQVSLVGGEPLMRRRELDIILPALSARKIFVIVVTSGVIPIPVEWMKLPRLRVAVSVDGLPEHHDVRRKPATYERVLKNIAGSRINIHWVITKPMLARRGYFEEYVAYWSARPEVEHIWVSLYSPQVGEQSPEMLTAADRSQIAVDLPALHSKYPKLLVNAGMAQAFVQPPENPEQCLFSNLSVNYSADLKTRIEPCVFGGTPDCSQCGCSASNALHWIKSVKIAGGLQVEDAARFSLRVGRIMSRMRSRSPRPIRWERAVPKSNTDLVQIEL
jgi:organic radical activating enzyme